MTATQQVGLAITFVFYIFIWAYGWASIDTYGFTRKNVCIVLSPLLLSIPAMLGVFG